MFVLTFHNIHRISIHAPRMQSDTFTVLHRCNDIPISIHAPRMQSDAQLAIISWIESISIHAPRMQSDVAIAILFDRKGKFQSTLRVCRATVFVLTFHNIHRISIHAPRMQSDTFTVLHRCNDIPISIHAPRMQSDAQLAIISWIESISIHAPRMQSDLDPRPPHSQTA